MCGPIGWNARGIHHNGLTSPLPVLVLQKNGNAFVVGFEHQILSLPTCTLCSENSKYHIYAPQYPTLF